jgi:HAD superfamily hydrolase (TIGR01662 family)
MSENDRLLSLLAHTSLLLLDFDGPVCEVFAGYPAPKVAGRLRRVLAQAGISVPDALANETDPLEVLRWVGRMECRDVICMVEDALRAAELEAVRVAAPTPYAREAIAAASQAGRTVAVVSNNSEPAVAAYLARHWLDQHVRFVVGREYAAPNQMKPNPAPILRALTAANAAPARCLLVGDSITDILAARAAGVRVIAYANKPNKVLPFIKASPDAVITGMVEIALVVRNAGDHT